MQTLTPHEMQPGMIVQEAIITPSGQLLAEPGAEVTRQLINRMKLYRVESAKVIDPTKPEVPQKPSQASGKVDITSAVIQVKQNEFSSARSDKIIAATGPAIKQDAKEHLADIKTNKQRVYASAQFRSFQLQYILLMEKLKSVFAETIDNGTAIPTEELLSSMSSLYSSTSTIIEIFDMLNNVRSVDDSIYAHCINVAIISRIIGHWLKLNAHDLDQLTLAGLLHDIGKVPIPEEVLNKPGKLTDEEFAMIKSHPKLGYDVLKSQNIDPRIKKATLMHHERCDGSGYPSHLEEDLIEEFALIIGIADVYDAMTAARSYRQPLCAFQVISSFEKDGYQKYHAKYLLTFLQQIATTYQSNRIILNDGRGAKIVMLNKNNLSRPIVQFNDNSCLDLSTAPEFYITAVL